MTHWHWHDPQWLWALAALAVVALVRRRRGVAVIVVPHAAEWQRSGAVKSAAWPAVLAYAGLALLAIALARPQWIEEVKPERNPGHDLILAIDLSTSMYAEDFQTDGRTQNRLQTIKPIIEAFINRRPDDRIGIVVFAGRAYTFAPLTFDHDWLRRQMARITIGMIEDGTAIGDAIGVSLARLQQGAKTQGAKREGAFVVLLTDGASNRGALEPRQVAGLAAERGVPVFTIGAWVEGMVPMPVFDYAGKRTGTELRRSELDGLLLRDIAETTGGLFFRASDTRSIEAAFAAVDRATRVEFDAPAVRVTREIFRWVLAPGLVALVAAVLLEVRRRGEGGLWTGLVRTSVEGARVTGAASARAVRPWWLGLAVVLGIGAWLGPRWGELETKGVEPAREVLIALDLSRSMLANDVAPSRIERAHAVVRSLLDGLQGERAGLVVFAGSAFVQVPLSSDYQIMREFLPELRPDYLPRGGSDYAGMLRAAREGFSEDADVDRTLVVLSDGESTTEDWPAELAALKARGVAVVGLAIGTAAGGDVPARDDGGAVARSRLEPGTLQALAKGTGGEFRDVSGDFDAKALGRETVAAGARTRSAERRMARAEEQYQWLLAPALALGLLGLAREVAVRPRARAILRGAALGLTAGVAVLVTRAHDLGDALSGEAPAGDKLQWLVHHLAWHPTMEAGDLRLMAELTINYGLETLGKGLAVEQGALRDALDAVTIGERMNARAADWRRLRAELERLRLRRADPETNQRPPEQKKEALDEEDRATQTNGQGSQQTTAESMGMGGVAKTDAMLGELKKEIAKRVAGPKPAAVGRVRAGGEIGDGGAAQKAKDPLRTLLLRRYREVTTQDKPAVLFQAMQGDAQNAPAGGKDW